jgi:hypothetical protein
MRCIVCNQYFKLNKNLSNKETVTRCEDCLDVGYNPDSSFDDSEQVEIETLVNPSGKTQAKYIE